MGREVALNALTAGISRLRTRGGADPATLYDLLNGYVTLSGTIRSRPGTVEDTTALAGTMGLCAFGGELVVFAKADVTVPTGYVCEILTHPDDDTAELSAIHFAGPFVGYLYVVAEWSDEQVFHYWLRSADDWSASSVYEVGDLVQPTTPNGFIYRANRIGGRLTLWAPDVARVLADVIEPVTESSFKHTVVAALGANPRSGTIEPVWSLEANGVTIEDADSDAPPPVPESTDPDAPLLLGDPERYEFRRGISP